MGRLLTRSIAPALALLLAATLLGACGADEEEKEGLFEGEPVELGSLEWNVLFSRRLNPSDIEDREYLEGQQPPGADSTYLGIFVQVENLNEDEAQSLPLELTIIDTEGEEYTSIESESPYALHLDTPIPAGDEVPALDSTPQVGPIQGSMVLFLVPDQAFENRPLELEIPGQDGPATVELDL
jgi:hypothetical protein